MDLTRRPFEETIGTLDLATWRTPVGRRLAGLVVRLAGWTAYTYVMLATGLVGVLVVAGATAAVAEIYEHVVSEGGLAVWDRPVLDWVITWRTPVLNRWVTHLTDTAGPVGLPVVALLVLGGLALVWKRRTPLILGVIALLGSLAMTVVGKALVGRHRPPFADAVPPFEYSASFPSGHTLNAAVFAGLVVYLLLTHEVHRITRWLTALAGVIYVLAIGMSRVYLGHHWLTDVLVAYVLGLLWLAILITTHRLALTVGRRRRQLAELQAAGVR